MSSLDLCSPRPSGGFAPRLGRLLFSGGALVGLALALPVRVGFVQGGSMQPSLHPGQPFLYRPGLKPEDLRRGEIVMARVDGRLCVKRIYALGGDRFWVIRAPGPGNPPVMLLSRDGIVHIESWKKRYPNRWFLEVRVPRTAVYLVGDGIFSVDSRQLGPIPASAVVGQVVLPAPPLPGGSPLIVPWCARRRVPPRDVTAASASPRRATVSGPAAPADL
jgi:signal peptidase I